MTKEAHIYQKDGHGWYIESAGNLVGPLDTCQDAQAYLELMIMVCAARTEFVCLDRGCI